MNKPSTNQHFTKQTRYMEIPKQDYSTKESLYWLDHPSDLQLSFSITQIEDFNATFKLRTKVSMTETGNRFENHAKLSRRKLSTYNPSIYHHEISIDRSDEPEPKPKVSWMKTHKLDRNQANERIVCTIFRVARMTENYGEAMRRRRWATEMGQFFPFY